MTLIESLACLLIVLLLGALGLVCLQTALLQAEILRQKTAAYNNDLYYYAEHLHEPLGGWSSWQEPGREAP